MARITFVLIALVAVVVGALAAGDHDRHSVSVSANSEALEGLGERAVAHGIDQHTFGIVHSNHQRALIERHGGSHSAHPKGCESHGGSSCSSACGLNENAHWGLEGEIGPKQIATVQSRWDDNELDARYRPPIANT